MKNKSFLNSCVFVTTFVYGVTVVEATPTNVICNSNEVRLVEDSSQKKKKDKRKEERVLGKAGVGASKYSGFYIGVGPYFQSVSREMNISDDWETLAAKHDNFVQKDRRLRVFDKKNDSIGCSFVTGIGKVFNDLFYVGGEVSVGIGSSKKQSQDSEYIRYEVTGSGQSLEKLKKYDTVVAVSRRVVPFLVGRFGVYVEPLDSVICLRAGCGFLGTEFRAKKLDKSIKYEAVPVVGIDFEKSLCSSCDSWNVRISVDYCFPSDKHKNCIRHDPSVKDECNTVCRVKTKSYILAVMCTYNFKLF